MKLRIPIVLAIAILASCAHNPPLEFHPYRACVPERDSGRELLDVGTVVGESWTDYGDRTYLFQSDSLPRDGKHVREVLKIKRPCAAASGVTVEAQNHGTKHR